jgi:hypothetical protein
MFVKILDLLPFHDYHNDALKDKIFDNIVKIDYIKEAVHLKKQIMLYEDISKIPSVVADVIVEFAVSKKPLVYVSIAVDMAKISAAVQFQPALLVALTKYFKQQEKKTTTIPMMLTLLQEEDPNLWVWQKVAADHLIAILVRPPLHTNQRDLVYHVPGTVISFNSAGYVAKGAIWDSSKVPFSPTTSFTGGVLLGPHAVGKKYTVLAALMRLKDIAPTSRAHLGRISHKGMVIVTTAAKMSCWRAAIEAFLPSNWKVMYINNDKTLLTELKNPTFMSADLVVVSRHAVLSAATSFFLRSHKQTLYTMQWRAAVYDEAETLVATKSTKEDYLTLDRKAIIIKSLFLGHHTIVLTSNMDDWTDSMSDACIYLVGVTQDHADIYPPPVSFSDALKRGFETVFGASGGQRFLIKKTTREDILSHFLAHHVFKIMGHASLAPTLLQYHRNDGAIEHSGGLFTSEEMEDMNSISSAYRHEPNMVALSRLVIFLASQLKNKVLIYDHANMDCNAFRECLQEHELSITNIPGNRSTLQLKRLRESIIDVDVAKKQVIVVGDCQGGELHFPSVTHIIVAGSGARGGTYHDFSKCGEFMGRATRYGLMVGKPIVKINFI